MTRRDELLDATVDYLLDHGVSSLSLRPLAAAIGTNARMLIYHFETREQLVEAALHAALQRIQQRFLERPDVLTFWKWATDPAALPYVRLIFEVHGLAPRNPRVFGKYVRNAIESWTEIIAAQTRDREQARIVVAVFDGLLLDYLATGDRIRTTRALRRFLKGAT